VLEQQNLSEKMKKNTIIQTFVEVIKRLSEKTGLPEEEVTKETLQYLKEEIEKQITLTKPQKQNNLEIKKQLKTKDKQIQDLQKELTQQKEINKGIIKLTKQQQEQLIDLYENKKISKTTYQVLKEIQRTQPKKLTQKEKDIIQLYEEQNKLA
jgi:hypothetical protein